MKINGSSDIVRGGKAETPVPVNGRQGPPPAQAAPPGAESATLKLSGMSTKVGEMASTLAASGEFDQAKVDAIKQAIVEGRLKVNSEAIAGRMMTTLREMLDGNRQE